MDFKVLITESALSDLREIVEFVALDDARAAQRLGSKLLSRIDALATMPERFALHDAQRAIRKMPLASYIVFYSIDYQAGVVNILHFWHGARLLPDF